MNTTALVSRVENNALPQWNAGSAGYIGMQSGGDSEANRAGARMGMAVRKYWWIVLAAWAVIAIPASIYLWRANSPMYVATGAVEVQPMQIDSVTGGGRTTPMYNEFFRSQAELLKNPEVLELALGMDVKGHKPRSRQYLIAGKYPQFDKVADQVAYLEDHVDVYAIPGTELITVSATEKDNQFASDIVNEVLAAFIQYRADNNEMNRDVQLKDVQTLLDTANTLKQSAMNQIEARTRDGDRYWTDNGQKIILDSLAASKDAQAKLMSQKENLAAKLENLQSHKMSDEKEYKASITTDTDPQIQQWTSEHIKIQLADNVLASKHATAEHPDRVEYRKQLKVLDQKIAGRKQEIQNNAWRVYQASFAIDNTKKIDETKEELSAVTQQLAALNNRIDEQEALAKDSGSKSDFVLSKKAEITDTDAAIKRYQDRIAEINRMNTESGFVTSRNAPVPMTARVDKRPRMIATANGLGLMLGLGLLALMVKLRDKIDGADDLGKAYQPLIVGTVSHAGSAARGLPGRMSRKILGEEMRLLHANLLPPGRTDRRVMMVTSPTPANGKTSIASQLALSLAKSGLEVLLIDADLRKRDLSTMFDVGFRPGLSELLQGKEPELVRPVELLPNLRLMGAGSRLERNPVELFQRKHFHESLALLQDKFDCIIVDTPPTLVVADSRLIARSCDEVLCVVRAQVSSPKEVDQTIDALQRITGKTPKIIVNGVAHRQSYYKYKFAYTHGLDLDGAEAAAETGGMGDMGSEATTNGTIS